MVEYTLMYVHKRTHDILKVLCKEYLQKTIANCLDIIIEDFIDAYELDVGELLQKVVRQRRKELQQTSK